MGNEAATVLAAALTWLLKDGVGMIARIVFAWAKGSCLDSGFSNLYNLSFFLKIIFAIDNKRWRLVADLLNDASFFMDLLAPYFPQWCYTPFACSASLLRSIVGVAGATTRMSVIRHQVSIYF